MSQYRQALTVARDKRYLLGEGTALNNLGTLYAGLGQRAEAVAHYQQALAIGREAEDLQGPAKALHNLGLLHGASGRLDEALEHFQEALAIAQESREAHIEAGVRSSLGVLYAQLDQPAEAAEQLQRALALRRALGDRAGEANTLVKLSVGREAAVDPRSAIERLMDAQSIYRELGDLTGEVQVWFHLAALLRVVSPRDALQQLEYAIELVEDVRAGILSEELRTSYFATVSDLYTACVGLLVELDERQQALYMAERGRARAFLDLLAAAQAEVREGVDPSLGEQERRALAELSDLRQRLVAARAQGEQNAEAIAELEKQTQAKTHELHTLEAEIRSANPRYAALTQLTAWDLPEIQERLLDEDTALLEYVLSDRGSLLFCVLKDEFEVFSLPPREEIEHQVRELRAAVLHGLHAYPHGHELYRALVAPAAHLIEGKDLLICADGALHYLPFSLLLTEEPGSDDTPGDGRIDPGPQRSAVAGAEPALREQLERELAQVPGFDFARLPYLVRGHAISYAPSATVAGLVREEATAKEQVYDAELAGFADPRGLGGAGEEEIELGAALAHTRDRLEPLPMTAEEVWTLAEVVSRGGVADGRPDRYDDERVSLRTAGEATKDEIAAITSGERRFRFFHIASHGLLDAEKPQFSGLVFSPGPEGDPFWRTFEIFNARIPSELVVLSACETGLGKIVSGEGIVGLTRAFLYAGAQTVCVSLWKVAEESSPRLMRSFYEAILAGGGKARALRSAQLEMLDEGLYAHPYWWAPFVVVGSR